MQKVIQEKRYYGGCKFVDEVETLAKERLCKIYGAEYANVQLIVERKQTQRIYGVIKSW